jgi:hypothetical protein
VLALQQMIGVRLDLSFCLKAFGSLYPLHLHFLLMEGWGMRPSVPHPRQGEKRV